MNSLNFIYVGIGGAIGAISRFFVSTIVDNNSQNTFPYGTLSVNLLGCFLLGIFYALVSDKSNLSPQVQIMVSVGFLGAFTTFSTFSLETLKIINENNIGKALLYVGLSVVIGLIAVWMGVIFVNFLKQQC